MLCSRCMRVYLLCSVKWALLWSLYSSFQLFYVALCFAPCVAFHQITLQNRFRLHPQRNSSCNMDWNVVHFTNNLQACSYGRWLFACERVSIETGYSALADKIFNTIAGKVMYYMRWQHTPNIIFSIRLKLVISVVQEKSKQYSLEKRSEASQPVWRQ